MKEDILTDEGKIICELTNIFTNKNKEIDRLKDLCNKYEEEHKTAFKLWTQKIEEMPDYEERMKLKKEVIRLNNIINELENTIANFIENHTESYIDWKYDREIYLAESNILQKLFDTYLDKLKELKENK